jgi:hypothetical protein
MFTRIIRLFTAALLAAAFVAPLFAAAQAVGDGIVRVKSAYPLDETIARLKQDIAAKGIRFFQEIDQHQLAAEAGIKVLPSTLLVFGNPPARHAVPDGESAGRAGLAGAPARAAGRAGRRLGRLHGFHLDRAPSRNQGKRAAAIQDRFGRDRVDHVERADQVGVGFVHRQPRAARRRDRITRRSTQWTEQTSSA